MSDPLDLESFSRCVGDTFKMHVSDEQSLEIRLLEANATNSEQLKGEDRQPFRLEFRGPVDPVLAQRIYALAHPTLGTHDVFLVPVARDEEGTRYEAVFN